jgi:hypothetical protein
VEEREYWQKTLRGRGREGEKKEKKKRSQDDVYVIK